MSTALSDPPRALPIASATSPERRVVRRHALRTTQDSTLLAEWRMLFAQDSRACAWQHPQSVCAEAEHLSPSRLQSAFLGCYESENLVGAAILLPKSIRTNQAGAFGPGWCLHGYRLVGGRMLNVAQSSGVDRELWNESLKFVQQQSADFLLIEDLDRESSLARQVQEELPRDWRLFVPSGRQARLRIQFPESGDGYWEQFSKKTLSTFRRKLKKFGKTRLERIVHADQVPEFLACAHEISKQTWQSRQLGLRVRNSDAERASLAALAEAGLLRCYLWHSNGEPAAFCIGNQAHGTFNYEEVGYATKFARFSPGQMLVVQMIEDLLAHNRPRWFDFGGGDADYKRMFANHVSESGTVWVTPPTWKARGSLAWIQSCRGLKRTVRRTISTLGLATRVRQWIRYGGQRSDGGVSAPRSGEREEDDQ